MNRLLRWCIAAILVPGCGPSGSAIDDGVVPESAVLTAHPPTPRVEPSSPAELPDDLTRAIGQEEMLLVADEVFDRFRHVAQESHSAAFAAEIDMNDTNIGARAGYPCSEGPRVWLVDIHGGSFTERLTRDVARMMLCHELGHFFAGFPYWGEYPREPKRQQSCVTYSGIYPSAEGQSDYFATKDCLWRVWAGDPNNARFKALAPERGRELCDSAWSCQAQRDLCYRSVVAGGKWAEWLRGSADIDHPDPTVVGVTIGGYPQTLQCRFDTMIAGALCAKHNDLTIIPGLLQSPVTGLYGDHSVASESAAEPYACHDGPGARPACWFKPHMPDIVLQDCSSIPEVGMCDGNDVVTCGAREGIRYQTCQQGCVMYDYNEDGTLRATCTEWI